jgi:GMP synthase-like glutamine amidotransferase
MSVLILKNIKTEGPGTIEDFLIQMGISYRIIDLQSEPIPPTESFSALIMLGGPMSVNDSDIYPYIKDEEELTRNFIKENKKVLGICLGAQIMAKALGAKVCRGKEPEIGWHDIELTESGLRDCLMKKLAIHPKAGDFWKRFKVFHWHGETFDIPEGAERLAKSDLYQNQAFRYGSNAYAFQFHIEVTKNIVYDWLKNEPIDQKKLRDETEKVYEVCRGRAENFYKAFFS